MNSERQDEDVVRIVNCINSCWPEYSFTALDVRRPCGEKFRDVLGKFLKGFLSCNYQLPSVSYFVCAHLHITFWNLINFYPVVK